MPAVPNLNYDDVITETWVDAVKDNLNGVLPAGNVPRVRATAAAVQSVASGGVVTLVWAGTETYDTNGFHSTSVNTSRLTVPTGYGGVYCIWYATYCAPGTEIMSAWVFKNGTGARYAFSQGKNDTTNGVAIAATSLIELAAGDYVEVIAFQNSGSAKDVNTSTLGEFGMYLVGPS